MPFSGSNMHLFTKWSPPLESACFSASKWIPHFLLWQKKIQVSYYKCHFPLKYASIQQVVTTIGISVLFSIKMDTLFFVMAEKKSRCHITNAQNLCNMTPRAQIFDLLKKILLSNYIYPQNIRRNEDALNLHFHVSKSSLLFISHPII